MYTLLAAEPSGALFDFSSFFSFIGDAFSDLYFNDAVDILILTFLFALSYKFLRNRKAGALIVGIVICIVILVIATVFNLSGLRYLLSGIFQIGAIALIIIFQPEIRELLEKMGSGSLRGIRSFGDHGNKRRMQFRMIDHICKAVQILAVERTGALIVIERTTKLDDIISTGTELNADISDSLLRNLFFNRAPLHDGAVVIQDGRIAAASCILPLPKRTFVDSDLGTRHRAAIGLSETSDAIIIIVSEETGVISVAEETEMMRDFTPDTLRKYLHKELLHDVDVENN